MEPKKFNKMMFAMAIVVIILSVATTMLLVNKSSSNNTDELDTNDTTSGVISLNVAQEPQEYASNGKISLDIVDNLKNNSEE